MRDADLLRWFVIGLAWWLAIDIALLLVLLIASLFKDPPKWWVRGRIPDYYNPKDWSPKGADAEDISTR